MEDKTFELIEKMYSEMQQGFKELREGQKKLEGRLDGVEGEVKKLGSKIDGEVTPKIESLYDGYKQNTEQLTRVEQEVSQHEKFILERVK